MTTNQSPSVEQYRLANSFASLCSTLSQRRYADRIGRPLGNWVLPDDRQLPNALLGHSVETIIHTPLSKVRSTRGIGDKKLRSMIKLLARVAGDDPSHDGLKRSPVEYAPAGGRAGTSARSAGGSGGHAASHREFNAAGVSEAIWERWCETVKNAEIEDEALGRFAPSLRSLSTVIWNAPLGTYANRSLRSIRRMKTHGLKRVHAILEVFHSIDERIADAGGAAASRSLLLPQVVLSAGPWLDETLDSEDLPDADDVLKGLVVPLLHQIRIDAGDDRAEMAKARIGIDQPCRDVRILSEHARVTRARVYQRIDQCSQIMEVRWPEGRERVGRLAEKFESIDKTHAARRLLDDAMLLCFRPPRKTAT
jgi:hypothetical protein